MLKKILLQQCRPDQAAQNSGKSSAPAASSTSQKAQQS
jgi:hypothetical protein